MDSGVVMSSRVRNKKNARLHRSLKERASYDAMQSQVWSDIGAFHRKSGTFSTTGAMKDAFIQKDKDIKEYLAAFPLQDGQKGLIVFINGNNVYPTGEQVVFFQPFHLFFGFDADIE